MTQGTVRVPIREKVGYAFGDVASCIFWQTLGSFLLFFYTDVFGIPAAAAGTMFLVTRLWDAVNDPMMGTIADRTHTRWGRFRPYLLWMAAPFAIIGVLLFTTPDLGPTGKLVYAYITYNLMMMVYTAINIPYSSLLGVITSNPTERISLSSYKFVGAFTGGLLIQAFTLPLVGYFGQGNQAVGFQRTMILYAVVAFALFVVTFLSIKERVQPDPSQKSNIRQDLRDLSKNKPWFILMLLGLFTLSYVAIRNGITIYYFKYFVKNETLYNSYMVSATFAVIIGIFVVERLARKYGKVRIYMILMGISTLMTVAFYWLRPQDIFWMFTLNIIANFTMGPTSPLIWSMYADVADWSEWKTGRRATGLVFSAATFSQKMGWAIGGALPGWLLGLFHYQAGLANQPPESIFGLRLMISFIPAVGSILATLFVMFYKLDERTMKQIEAELNERRAHAEQAVPEAAATT
ncbi:MAG: MFS transporter [Acidobacteria bacterium]|nr:MAG: MFS transporter [Acidobacteriota bacterium]